MPLYTLHDAWVCEIPFFPQFESHDSLPVHEDRGLRFVVVGGGPTGVEVAGAIVELLALCQKRDRLRPSRSPSRVILVDAADRLLGAFKEPLSSYALDHLTQLGVEVHRSAMVKSVDHESVKLSDGLRSIQADLVIWAGGSNGQRNHCRFTARCADAGGRVESNPTFRSQDTTRCSSLAMLQPSPLVGKPASSLRNSPQSQFSLANMQQNSFSQRIVAQAVTRSPTRTEA